MSRINKLRFCNLNYNNNSMKINDELFILNGENTLFNLRNGGGKSVLVQMISAPFVGGRKRDTKDREFSSYFTSSTPTYILVEWKLDDAAGYLLTGMMVRKKDYSSDEDSKEKLDIYNFIYQYNEANPYDIKSIPFIEQTDNKKTVKTYSNSKKLFEKLKGDRELKFNYYDMNNTATSRAYFDKLKEYKIDRKEWESIIKKINLKESGLSDLFTNAKNTEGLVKEWFLPNIAIKLNKDNDRIKEYRDLINSYILTYKNNENSIEKKRKIELFNEEIKVVYEGCNTYLDTINNRKFQENKIANIIEELDNKHDFNEKEIEKLENEIRKIDDSIKELGYEKLSLEIYKNKDQLNDLIVKKDNQNRLISEIIEKLDSLKNKRNIYACANIYNRYQETSKELQDIENKLEILKREKEDNTPRINDLGFTIRNILNDELESLKTLINEEKTKKDSLNQEKVDLEKEVKSSREKLGRLIQNSGKFQEAIKGFDKEEIRFNKKYNENLYRNIEKLYNNQFILELEKKIEDRINEITKEITKLTRELIDSNEEVKRKENKKQSINEDLVKADSNLKIQKENLSNLENQIEERKEILKYIGYPKEKLFETEDIIQNFEREIKIIRGDESKLKKAKDELKSEVEKLETGRVLELSKEVLNALKAKDISIVYGMEWLKKNNKSSKENEEIVNNNPFIPYSLIMDNRDIEILTKEKIDVFTSNPISIVNRDSLEKVIINKDSNLAFEGDVKFLISFNNKLLNEEELEELINYKKEKITEFDDELAKKFDEIQLYEDKMNKVKYSNLSFEGYENTKNEINKLTDSLQELKGEEVIVREEINGLKKLIDETDNNINNLKKENDKSNSKKDDFNELKLDYEKYLKNLNEDKINQEKINVFNKKIEENIKREKELIDFIEQCKDTIISYNTKKDNTSNDLLNYEGYKTGEVIKKDKEDLLSEYSSLTKNITDTEAELREKEKLARDKYKKEEETLIKKAEDYKLKDEDYKTVIYNIDKEREIEIEIEKKEDYLNNEKDNLSNISSNIAGSETSLNVKFNNLKKIYETDNPKSKDLLYEKDYKKEEAELKVEKNILSDKMGKVNKLLNTIDTSRRSFDEFNHLVIEEIIELELNYDNLKDDIGMAKRDLNKFKDKETKDESRLYNNLRDIKDTGEFKEDLLFKEPLETLLFIVSKPEELLKNLNIITQGYNSLVEKLISDIELIKKEEETVIESLLEYIKEVHENINKIDSNSSITIKDKSIKMLNIKVQEWEENKEIYKIKLKDYIAEIREQSIINLNKNESIDNLISTKINIEKLYDEVVSISSIDIKLYKIEEDKQRKISWDEVAKNSGGEGFLSAFVILSSLMSYMRKDETDIFSRKEDGKVLIMDNPFAQTSSAHLLKPLIEVAKKSNTQLICLSDLRGDAILNRFDNIYLLNLISSKTYMGNKYLKAEHIKGNEDEGHVLTASRFKIEEQIRLF